MFPGMIALAACADNPTARWLLCDGRSLLKADYADLHAAIGDTFGSADAEHFNIPDLRGRAPVGTGQGSGLTQRDLADSGGEETHVLTVGELAEHSHQLDLVLLSGSVVGVPLTGQPAGDYGDLSTKTAGSGTAHNNMPPFLALNFFIYAG